MMAASVNLSSTNSDLRKAVEQLRKAEADTTRYVKIMSVEQALLAQLLVRESGRGR